MTVTDQIFRKVAEASIPHFFITVEFAASGTEMPEHKEGEWRLIFTFFPTDSVVDERYALKNKVQMKSKN